jgi:hypothetical protein
MSEQDRPWIWEVPASSESIKTCMSRHDAGDDHPEVQCLVNESHLGYGTYGAYGIGENIGASLAAITSSVIHIAIGKWILDDPITLDKVLKSLGNI